MNENDIIGLDEVDPEDVIDFLEQSFDIEFDGQELEKISTFSQLCDIVESKITVKHEDSCTSQQAFYKLRSEIASVLKLSKEKILPDTQLESLFPRKDRKFVLHEVECKMNFEMNLLAPKKLVRLPFVILAVVASIMQFINTDIAVAGFVISSLMIQLVSWLGKEFRVKSIRDVVREIEVSHYRQIRRNSSTVNKFEIASLIRKAFKPEPALMTRNKKYKLV